VKEAFLTIRDVADVTGGLTKNAKRDALDTRRPYLTVANVYANRLELENVGSIGIQASEAARVELQVGDLLVVEGNGSLAQLGRVAVWTGAIPRCVHQNHLIKVRPRTGVTSKWLLYWLLSPEGRSAIEAVGSSTSGLHTLSISKVEGLPVRLRPLAEQHRIIDTIETHFSRLDAAVASLTRAKANLKRARASVLKAAVEGRLVPTEAALARAEGRAYEPASVLLDRILVEREAAWAASGARGKYAEPAKPETEGLAELPEGWCWATPDQVSARVTVGHVGSMKSRYSEAGVPFLRSQNVRPNRFDWQGLLRIPDDFHHELEKSKVHPGDVLVVRSGSVGTACVLPETVGEANCSDLVLIKRPIIDSSYLAYYINAGATAQIERGKVGVALTHFNTASVAALHVALPPRTEQHRIVAEVDRRLSVLDALDATVDANLARCARLRQSILKRAFEGRLVPAEAPAAALPFAAEPPSATCGTSL
jgi:type I restriction enzyme S subunit